MTFNQLGLNPKIVEALNQKGYSEPTPIQEKAIPAILKGSHIFGCAQTGTGKTAAFALPIIQFLTVRTDHSKPAALILAPTRELAIQIGQSFDDYSRGSGTRHVLLYGGTSQVKQVEKLRRGVDIIIATPGRLLDLLNQGHVKLEKISYLILDEADRMLDMGFINDIRKILKKLPVVRQTLFFSATVDPNIRTLSESILKRDAIKIETSVVSSAAEKINQSVYFVSKSDKTGLLRHVINQHQIRNALVFTRTKHGADRVVRDLVKSGIDAAAIHGNKSQNARERALKGFKDKSLRILVATDIASRGIDISKLSHVINYEIPEVSETYIHRIGRTARAGESGFAMSFCTPEEKKYWKDINLLAVNKINVVKGHPYEDRSSLAPQIKNR